MSWAIIIHPMDYYHDRKSCRRHTPLLKAKLTCIYEVEQFVDDFEMEKVEANKSLNTSIKRGHRDANDKRGQIA